MHWLFRFIVIIVGNILALWFANHYIAGVVVNMQWGHLLLLAFILALLNFILKPILDIIFAPVIILTLGLGLLIVNGLIVWLLPVIAAHVDFLQGSIIIQTFAALLWTTLVVSFINFVLHYAMF